MKKFYTTLLLVLVAITASAQEVNDTTYVMFDFNQNPWNHPTTGLGEKWYPDYDDPTGFIKNETTFDWAISEGSDKKVLVIVTPPADYDPEEGTKTALMFHGPNYNEDNKGNVIETMLWMNPSSTIRFKSPQGYKFGKMLFYDYRNNLFTIDTEEIVKAYREGSWHDDNLKIWKPTTPKKNKDNLECWQGDETNILFDYHDMKAVFRKVDIRLVPDGSSGISNLQATKKESNTMTTLDGRTVNKSEGLRKGVYIVDGKKVVVK